MKKKKTNRKIKPMALKRDHLVQHTYIYCELKYSFVPHPSIVLHRFCFFFFLPNCHNKRAHVS